MEAGLPNITGGIRIHAPTYLLDNYPFNAFTQGAQITRLGGERGMKTFQLLFDASFSNPTYGNSNTVTPESLTTFILIKY